ncbi:hypothetical protein I5E68_07190 [Novosphingobium sp. YJ-S2-02]|uniref:Uncharacterized protein n=1 Tax=Novosphingobium aureum TaxID=2792964 RepID=A0A931MKR5_9SPHN|nr:hypothetical protein [Novosphingobium aureum]MBH0112735.1 hypothetical protein [Novosphingobium aureum]
MLKASEQTPVERTIEMLERRLEPVTIALCLGVSQNQCDKLIRLAKREIKARKSRAASEYSQRYNLPGQLEAARAKVAMLERKAVRLGMAELVEARA